MTVDNASFQLVDNSDAGTPFGLSLTNEGNRVTLTSADAATVLATLAYGTSSTDGSVPAAADQSIVLDPDMTGTTYVEHETASGGASSFSPGTKSDGTAFPGPDGIYGAR